MLRKTMIGLAVLLLAIVVLCGAAIMYVKPTEALNLDYEQVPVAQKALEMIKARKLEVRLSERDLNDILKKQLAARAKIGPNATIEGARFEQRGSRLTAYVNIRTVGGIAVGGAIDFTLEWKSPELIVRPTEPRIRGLSVPDAWLPLEPIVIRADELLPPLVTIKDVRFEDAGITIAFKLE
ncbi:hypothetical protein ACFFNY_07275 [Paenibacillus hodogayensis]|uniref:DUF2993 domain-containing protein n=1 Tax=Paenibacillus hodogayensis TaxID=279208 RepID=A0ABV5VSV0_9BACL